MHVCRFDSDGTLIASGGAGKAALEAALASEFGITKLIDKLELSGRPDRSILRDLFRLHVIEDTPENWQRITEAYLRVLPTCLTSSKGRVLPGIAELLKQLHGRDDVAREALGEVQRRFNGRVAAERIWVIGDTPLDVRCARSIGARAVAVATGWHSRDELAEHAPDLLLTDLSDPQPLLSRWPIE